MSGNKNNSNDFNTNVLIIGKSGVGKSSLLNYIFDQELAESGSGRPVTKEEIYKYTMIHPSGTVITVFDTWGLEADKADRWTRLIMDEVKTHDCADINEWFHTIIYCISAKSARIEDFEKTQIRSLLGSGNKVIVCLTHCDTRNIESSISALTSELCHLGLKEADIIKTVSVSKKLLGSKEASPRQGKEEILSKIQSNLWNTISVKLPGQLRDYSNERLENWYEQCCGIIEAEITKETMESEAFANSLINRFSDGLKAVVKGIESEYKRRADEIMDYYTKLCDSVLSDNKSISCNFSFDVDFGDFSYWSESKTDIAINAVGSLIPGLNQLLADDKMYKRRENIEYEVELKKRAVKEDLGQYFFDLSSKMASADSGNDQKPKQKKTIDTLTAIENEMVIENVDLEFNNAIKLAPGSRLVIKDSNIRVRPSTVCAVYGEDASVRIENCTIKYHGTEANTFLRGMNLNVDLCETELTDCYRLIGYEEPHFDDHEDIQPYRRGEENPVPEPKEKCIRLFTNENMTISISNCSGEISSKIVELKSWSEISKITISNSRFTSLKNSQSEAEDTEILGRQPQLFLCRSFSVSDSFFENFGCKIIEADRYYEDCCISDSSFINCKYVVSAQIDSNKHKPDGPYILVNNCKFIECIKSLSVYNISLENCVFENALVRP